MDKDTIITLDEGKAILKKCKWGRYKICYPYKINGKIDLFNLCTGGSWLNLFKVIGFVAFLVALVLLYKHDVASLVECCNSCKDSLAPMVTQPGWG